MMSLKLRKGKAKSNKIDSDPAVQRYKSRNAVKIFSQAEVRVDEQRLIYCQKAPRLMCYSFLMNFANKEGRMRILHFSEEKPKNAGETQLHQDVLGARNTGAF